MWAHYARNHGGFAIIYHPEIVSAVKLLPEHEGTGDVHYQDELPNLKWFQGSREDMLGPILFTKSAEWAYEREFRLILSGSPGMPALYPAIDPDLVAGMILGTRCPPSVESTALAWQRSRPEFIVQKVSSTSGSYALETYDAERSISRYGHML